MSGTKERVRLKNITPATQLQIINFAREAITEIIREIGTAVADGSNGFLRLFVEINAAHGPLGWHQLTAISVGIHEDDGSRERSSFISMEKFLRLAKQHALFHDEWSSWQSRDPDKWEWGGAFIITTNVPELGGIVKILASFSGLSEFADETMGLLVLEKLHWIGTGVFVIVTDISGNNVAPKLLRHH